VAAEEAVRRDRRAAPASPADAGSRSMWQSMQVFWSTLSTRAMPLPVHAEPRHAPGSSSPDRWTGMPMSADKKPRWQPTHSSVPTRATEVCALWRAIDAASPRLGASIGARDHA
jgi:hypothetical protein